MVADFSLARSDATLLERIVARDQAALADLYDRHARLVFSLALRILRDRGEAEDVLQEVFIRVWDRAESYDQALGTPAAWLVRIARNRAIDRVRARTVRAAIDVPATMDAATEPAPGPDPELAASRSEEQRAISAALATLAPEQRILIERAFYEGLTYSELAAAFHLPLGTVKTRIRAGMQSLRMCLTALGGEAS
jgi:RNA polymerase sigma-70 factor, ECF subfamily